MDYRPKIRSFLAVLLLNAGRCYEAEICAILLPFRIAVAWYEFFPSSKVSVLAENHGLCIVHGFDRIYFDIYNSSLKKAIELKFAQFCSS